MKIKVGGTATMKLQVFQYEPVEVSSTLEIEEEFSDSDSGQEWLEVQGNKINESIKIDLERKAKEIVKKQSEIKKKLKEMI